MSTKTYFAILLVSFASIESLAAQSLAYVPLRSANGSSTSAYSTWEANRQAIAQSSVQQIRPEDRASIAGLRPRNVELLEDALLRKQPNKLQGSASLAREHILRVEEGTVIQLKAQLRGYMAEAMYMDRNPEFGFVQKANATQNDAYRWMPGRRTPIGVQIKYHQNGNSATYARDMEADRLAERFAIPNDHVENLKTYWQTKMNRLVAVGDTVGVAEAQAQYRRVIPIGATAAEIEAGVTGAYESLLAERASVYLPMGAGIALALGPIGWDLLHGKMQPNEAAYYMTRAGSVVVVGIVADSVLRQIWQGALRGTTRGNLMAATIMGIADTAWIVHDYGGWGAAIHQAKFYQSMVGDFSVITVGTITFIYIAPAVTTAAIETGPWAPVIGVSVGFIGSTITASVAYVAGNSATRMIIEKLDPEMLRQQENEQFKAVLKSLDEQSSAARDISTWN